MTENSSILLVACASSSFDDSHLFVDFAIFFHLFKYPIYSFSHGVGAHHFGGDFSHEAKSSFGTWLFKVPLERTVRDRSFVPRADFSGRRRMDWKGKGFSVAWSRT